MGKRDTYDVIVVGAGTAGIPCAIEAARHPNIRVLLLEKDQRIGGTLHLSGGHIAAANTRRQRSRGIVDSTDAHAADIERLSHGTARRDIVARAVELAPGVVDWLDEQGFDFTDASPLIPEGHEPYSAARTYEGREGGISILRILRKLLDERVREGRVEVRSSTPVTGLRTDDDGNVIGVTVWGTNGDEDIDAGAVVLASGGFAADPELFREIEGVPLFSCARPTSTGDGLQIARAIGGVVAGRGTYLPTVSGLPHPDLPHRSMRQPRPQLLLSKREPWEIYVDRHGKRFIAEDTPGSHAKEVALLGIDEMTFWLVFDAEALVSSTPVVLGWTSSQLDEFAGTRLGVHRAGDLKSLAQDAGIDPEALVATVDAYNDGQRTKAADPLGRQVRPAPIAKPPFYALRSHGVSLITFAGLDVDADLRVRRADGSTIGGLYAAGEIIGNGATAGHAFCSGMSVTPALAFGRWLGAKLGERIPVGAPIEA